jgi:excisionase family DNA binding protein
MSIEHSPIRQKRRGPRAREPIARICVSIPEFCQATGISRPTVYRMMNTGKLRFVQVGPRMRKIPTTEFNRLGLSGEPA